MRAVLRKDAMMKAESRRTWPRRANSREFEMEKRKRQGAGGAGSR